MNIRHPWGLHGLHHFVCSDISASHSSCWSFGGKCCQAGSALVFKPILSWTSAESASFFVETSAKVLLSLWKFWRTPSFRSSHGLGCSFGFRTHLPPGCDAATCWDGCSHSRRWTDHGGIWRWLKALCCPIAPQKCQCTLWKYCQYFHTYNIYVYIIIVIFYIFCLITLGRFKTWSFEGRFDVVLALSFAPACLFQTKGTSGDHCRHKRCWRCLCGRISFAGDCAFAEVFASSRSTFPMPPFLWSKLSLRWKHLCQTAFKEARHYVACVKLCKTTGFERLEANH